MLSREYGEKVFQTMDEYKIRLEHATEQNNKDRPVIVFLPTLKSIG